MTATKYGILKDVAKHSVIYGIGEILGKCLSFVLIPIYTHYLTTAEYGTLELLDLTTYILGIFLSMGLVQALVRCYYDYDDTKRRNQVISVALSTVWFVSLVVLAVLFLTSKQISVFVFKTDTNYKLFNIIFITMTFNLTSEIPLTLLRLQNRSLFYVTVSLIRLVLALILNILFIVHFRLGVQGILLGGLVSNAAVGLYLSAYTYWKIGFSYSFEITKSMIKFGYPLALSYLGMFALNFGDRFLLQRLSSLSEVGIYSLAYKFGMLPNMIILGPFQRIWGPKQYEISEEPNANSTYSLFFSYFMFIQLFFGLGLTVAIKDLLRIITAPAYFSAYLYVPFILSGYLFYGINSYMQFGILLKKKTIYITILSFVSAGLNLALNVILIPRYSIWGAAISTCASFFFLTACNYVISQKLYYIPYDFIRLGKLTVCAAAIYVGTLYIDTDSAYLSLFIKILLALTYPFVLFAVKFYSKEELSKLKELTLRLKSKLGKS